MVVCLWPAASIRFCLTRVKFNRIYGNSSLRAQISIQLRGKTVSFPYVSDVQLPTTRFLPRFQFAFVIIRLNIRPSLWKKRVYFIVNGKYERNILHFDPFIGNWNKFEGEIYLFSSCCSRLRVLITRVSIIRRIIVLYQKIVWVFIFRVAVKIHSFARRIKGSPISSIEIQRGSFLYPRNTTNFPHRTWQQGRFRRIF